MLAGFLFALSGFMHGTSNMIGFTLGAAWLPWCILYLDKILEEKNVVVMKDAATKLFK